MQVHLEIQNDLSELDTLKHRLEELQERWGFSDRCRSELNLVLEELVANIVEHGDASKPGMIEFGFKKDVDRLEITVIDDGPGFDPTSCGLPDTCQPLEQRRCGGLGLLFVRRFSDCCSYRRDKGKNILKLIKILPKECRP